MTIKNYLVVTKNFGAVDSVTEIDEARLYQWLKNGSIHNGDNVYEVVKKRVAVERDIILEDA